MIELPAPPEPRDLLRGRVAVVTAAAGTGIGFATARRFALEGASVMISDRHEGRLAAALNVLRAEVATPMGTVVRSAVQSFMTRHRIHSRLPET